MSSSTGGMFRQAAVCCCAVCLSSLVGTWVTLIVVVCASARGPDVTYVLSASADNSVSCSVPRRSQPGVLEYSRLGVPLVTPSVIGPWAMVDYEGRLWSCQRQVARNTVAWKCTLSISILGLLCSVWNLWIWRSFWNRPGVDRKRNRVLKDTGNAPWKGGSYT